MKLRGVWIHVLCFGLFMLRVNGQRSSYPVWYGPVAIRPSTGDSQQPLQAYDRSWGQRDVQVKGPAAEDNLQTNQDGFRDSSDSGANVIQQTKIDPWGPDDSQRKMDEDQDDRSLKSDIPTLNVIPPNEISVPGGLLAELTPFQDGPVMTTPGLNVPERGSEGSTGRDWQEQQKSGIDGSNQQIPSRPGETGFWNKENHQQAQNWQSSDVDGEASPEHGKPKDGVQPVGPGQEDDAHHNWQQRKDLGDSSGAWSPGYRPSSSWSEENQGGEERDDQNRGFQDQVPQTRDDNWTPRDDRRPDGYEYPREAWQADPNQQTGGQDFSFGAMPGDRVPSLNWQTSDDRGDYVGDWGSGKDSEDSNSQQSEDRNDHPPNRGFGASGTADGFEGNWPKQNLDLSKPGDDPKRSEISQQKISDPDSGGRSNEEWQSRPQGNDRTETTGDFMPGGLWAAVLDQGNLNIAFNQETTFSGGEDANNGPWSNGDPNLPKAPVQPGSDRPIHGFDRNPNAFPGDKIGNERPPLDDLPRPVDSGGFFEDHSQRSRGDSGGNFGSMARQPMDNRFSFDSMWKSQAPPVPSVQPLRPQGNYKGGDDGSRDQDGRLTTESLERTIPGTPGVDYPNYQSIPETGFRCQDTNQPGYYADVETGCQVYHICQSDGRHNSFLCPTGTIFNQRLFTCDWWHQYDCTTSMEHYALNQMLYIERDPQGNFKGSRYEGTNGPVGPDQTFRQSTGDRFPKPPKTPERSPEGFPKDSWTGPQGVFHPGRQASNPSLDNAGNIDDQSRSQGYDQNQGVRSGSDLGAGENLGFQPDKVSKDQSQGFHSSSNFGNSQSQGFLPDNNLRKDQSQGNLPGSNFGNDPSQGYLPGSNFGNDQSQGYVPGSNFGNDLSEGYLPGSNFGNDLSEGYLPGSNFGNDQSQGYVPGSNFENDQSQGDVPGSNFGNDQSQGYVPGSNFGNEQSQGFLLNQNVGFESSESFGNNRNQGMLPSGGLSNGQSGDVYPNGNSGADQNEGFDPNWNSGDDQSLGFTPNDMQWSNEQTDSGVGHGWDEQDSEHPNEGNSNWDSHGQTKIDPGFEIGSDSDSRANPKVDDETSHNGWVQQKLDNIDFFPDSRESNSHAGNGGIVRRQDGVNWNADNQDEYRYQDRVTSNDEQFKLDSSESNTDDVNRKLPKNFRDGRSENFSLNGWMEKLEDQKTLRLDKQQLLYWGSDKDALHSEDTKLSRNSFVAKEADGEPSGGKIMGYDTGDLRRGDTEDVGIPNDDYLTKNSDLRADDYYGYRLESDKVNDMQKVENTSTKDNLNDSADDNGVEGSIHKLPLTKSERTETETTERNDTTSEQSSSEEVDQSSDRDIPAGNKAASNADPLPLLERSKSDESNSNQDDSDSEYSSEERAADESKVHQASVTRSKDFDRLKSVTNRGSKLHKRGKISGNGPTASSRPGSSRRGRKKIRKSDKATEKILEPAASSPRMVVVARMRKSPSVNGQMFSSMGVSSEFPGRAVIVRTKPRTGSPFSERNVSHGGDDAIVAEDSKISQVFVKVSNITKVIGKRIAPANVTNQLKPLVTALHDGSRTLGRKVAKPLEHLTRLGNKADVRGHVSKLKNATSERVDGFAKSLRRYVLPLSVQSRKRVKRSKTFSDSERVADESKLSEVFAKASNVSIAISKHVLPTNITGKLKSSVATLGKGIESIGRQIANPFGSLADLRNATNIRGHVTKLFTGRAQKTDNGEKRQPRLTLPFNITLPKWG